MTDEKIISVLQFYHNTIMTKGLDPVESQEMPEDLKAELQYNLLGKTVLDHLAFMCETATTFVQEERREKAMRWLGFIQGSLYFCGFFTIDDLKNHSRPEGGD